MPLPLARPAGPEPTWGEDLQLVLSFTTYLGKVVKDRTVQLARTLRTTPSMVPAMLPAQPLVTCKSWSHEPAAFANSS